MNAEDFKNAFGRILTVIEKNEEYLIELDQKNGDGDLGLSMRSGFNTVNTALRSSDCDDLGRLMMIAATVLNENAPSSLGTILSLGMTGMARSLKGKRDVSTGELGEAMKSGLEVIMARAGSKPGEKTILDSLCPAVDELLAGDEQAFSRAAEKAALGSEKTKDMVACHGRAAYYAEKSLGVLDGGSVVGKLIFEALAER